jgi:hypothetical protein
LGDLNNSIKTFNGRSNFAAMKTSAVYFFSVGVVYYDVSGGSGPISDQLPLRR